MEIPKIGFIGFGVVNQAIYNNLKSKAKKKVSIYSKEYKYIHNQEDNLDSDLIIITVPTNHEKSIYDTNRNITENLEYLTEKNYSGLIVIKSTCLPSDIDRLMLKFDNFKNLSIVYWPEFLNSNSAKKDIKKEEIILGGDIKDAEEVLKIMYQVSIELSTKTYFYSAQEAMEFKFYRNIYAMYKYVFHNNIPNLFRTDPRVLQKMLTRYPIQDEKLRIGNDGKQGVGGACLPKDNLNFIQSHEEDSEEFDSSELLKNLDIFNRNFRDDLPEINY
jgi:UDP-glucose 6-dehydrogenase